MSGAGDYKHRVRFDRAVDTVDDATGEPMRTWEEIGTVWSRVEPLRGREGMIADGVESTSDTRIVTRYSSVMATVRAKDRAYFPLTDVFFNIESASDIDTKHQELEFRCSSGLNAG